MVHLPVIQTHFLSESISNKGLKGVESIRTIQKPVIKVKNVFDLEKNRADLANAGKVIQEFYHVNKS